MHVCMPAEHQAHRCPNSVFGRLQVIELAAAVHQLNQDKCQLENQMEMEEVFPLCHASCSANLYCVQTVHLSVIHHVPHAVAWTLTVSLYVCCAGESGQQAAAPAGRLAR